MRKLFGSIEYKFENSEEEEIFLKADHWLWTGGAVPLPRTGKVRKLPVRVATNPIWDSTGSYIQFATIGDRQIECDPDDGNMWIFTDELANNVVEFVGAENSVVILVGDQLKGSNCYCLDCGR